MSLFERRQRRRLTDEDAQAALLLVRGLGMSLQEAADRLALRKSSVSWLLARAERRRMPLIVDEAALEDSRRRHAVQQQEALAAGRRAPRFAWSPDAAHRAALADAARLTHLQWRAEELVLRDAAARVLGVEQVSKAWLSTPLGDVVVRIVVDADIVLEWARTQSSMYRILERLPHLPHGRRVVWAPDVKTTSAARARAAGAEVRDYAELLG